MDALRAARTAQVWHALTAAVVLLGLLVQLGLVVDGASVLIIEDPPGLIERLYRFFAYFTIQSNLLVFLGCLALARKPTVDVPGWRLVRLSSLVGITVTGLVHWFLLRPLLNLEGLSSLTDTTLHLVVPLMAVGGWVVFGPRPRIQPRQVGLFLLWPVLWLVATLLQARLTHWYPYPFLDAGKEGAGTVVVACIGITVLVVVFAAAYRFLDQRLPPAPLQGRPLPASVHQDDRNR